MSFNLDQRSVLVFTVPLIDTTCGGLQPLAASKEPFRPKGDFAGRTDKRTNGRTDKRTTGLRELYSNGVLTLWHVWHICHIIYIYAIHIDRQIDIHVKFSKHCYVCPLKGPVTIWPLVQTRPHCIELSIEFVWPNEYFNFCNVTLAIFIHFRRMPVHRFRITYIKYSFCCVLHL